MKSFFSFLSEARTSQAAEMACEKIAENVQPYDLREAVKQVIAKHGAEDCIHGISHHSVNKLGTIIVEEARKMDEQDMKARKKWTAILIAAMRNKSCST